MSGKTQGVQLLAGSVASPLRECFFAKGIRDKRAAVSRMPEYLKHFKPKEHEQHSN